MKKLFRRILVVSLLATLLLAVFSSAALAGNVCSEIKGSPRKTTSFTVTTGSGWLLGQKITLTQQKGTALGQYCGHYNKPYSTYGYFYVTIQRISGSGKTPSPSPGTARTAASPWARTRPTESPWNLSTKACI